MYLGGKVANFSAKDYHWSYYEARFKTDNLERQVLSIIIFSEVHLLNQAGLSPEAKYYY